MSDEESREPSGNWTGALQRFASRTLPFSKLLPERQPAYVASWTYVFGVLTIAALVWVIVLCWYAFFGLWPAPYLVIRIKSPRST